MRTIKSQKAVFEDVYNSALIVRIYDKVHSIYDEGLQIAKMLYFPSCNLLFDLKDGTILQTNLKQGDLDRIILY